MVKETKMLDKARDSFITTVLEHSSDDRLKRGSDHFWRLTVRSSCNEDALVDSEVIATCC
jgi:hypothetical protein